MELTIEAAKRIFEIVEEDEEIGFLKFNGEVGVIEELKMKSDIDRTTLFHRLDCIEPCGSTDFGIGLSAAVSMFERSGNKDRNQRIIFLTDAIPTVGASTQAIREMGETAFIQSQGRLGVTYWGIGFSFDSGSCAELSRGHSTSVSSISTSAELEETLRTSFNYQVSPIAFDVRIGLSSQDYSILEVYGGDSDCEKGDSLMEYLTLTASEVGVEGIKGSVLIIHLQSLHSDIHPHPSVEITIEFTPFGNTEKVRQVYEYFLNVEPIAVTEKAYALSVYYRTLQQVLPDRNVRKSRFTPDEVSIMMKLQSFLKSQRPEITARLTREIKVVDDLMAFHSKNEKSTTP
jgi:hypothetical protein